MFVENLLWPLTLGRGCAMRSARISLGPGCLHGHMVPGCGRWNELWAEVWRLGLSDPQSLLIRVGNLLPAPSLLPLFPSSLPPPSIPSSLVTFYLAFPQDIPMFTFHPVFLPPKHFLSPCLCESMSHLMVLAYLHFKTECTSQTPWRRGWWCPPLRARPLKAGHRSVKG